MNAIGSHQQFSFEYVVGKSLGNASLIFDKQTPQNHTKLDIKSNTILFNEHVEQTNNEKRLEIIGSECGSKLSAITKNPKYLIESTNSLISSKLKLSKIDQTRLQLPKRATFASQRKEHENTFRRTMTSHVSSSANHSNLSKLNIIPTNRRAITSTDHLDDKSIMVHRTESNLPLNSSISVFKKLPTTNNQLSSRLLKKAQQNFVNLPRETSSFKLPILVKRSASSIVKPIPSAYIQETPKLQLHPVGPKNRFTLQPKSIQPVYTSNASITSTIDHRHLPLVKDRMIKANLARKASFKCKSPVPHRPESSLSRSTNAAMTASQLSSKTLNPFQQTDINVILNEATRNQLKRLFQQLDTDKDGHLTYPQVQKCLPEKLPRAQDTFFRVLYDITSDTTYFGLHEFYSTAAIVELIRKQDTNIWNSLLDDVDFNYYRDDVLELLDQFDHRYSPISLTISFDSLIALIVNRITNGKYERITEQLESILPTIKTTKLTRLNFIAIVPVIIYIESLFDKGKSLFRFRDNSILDTHMQKASLSEKSFQAFIYADKDCSGTNKN